MHGGVYSGIELLFCSPQPSDFLLTNKKADWLTHAKSQLNLLSWFSPMNVEWMDGLSSSLIVVAWLLTCLQMQVFQSSMYVCMHAVKSSLLHSWPRYNQRSFQNNAGKRERKEINGLCSSSSCCQVKTLDRKGAQSNQIRSYCCVCAHYSAWKYQFSNNHWSQATLILVSTWMGDCSSVVWVLLLTF